MNDPEFLSEIRKLCCLACGKSDQIQAHHIKTRGSGGGDDAWNVIPLCILHHTSSSKAWHTIGWSDFFKHFPHVKEHLLSLGWEILYGKLLPPK